MSIRWFMVNAMHQISWIYSLNAPWSWRIMDWMGCSVAFFRAHDTFVWIIFHLKCVGNGKRISIDMILFLVVCSTQKKSINSDAKKIDAYLLQLNQRHIRGACLYICVQVKDYCSAKPFWDFIIAKLVKLRNSARCTEEKKNKIATTKICIRQPEIGQK